MRQIVLSATVLGLVLGTTQLAGAKTTGPLRRAGAAAKKVWSGSISVGRVHVGLAPVVSQDRAKVIGVFGAKAVGERVRAFGTFRAETKGDGSIAAGLASLAAGRGARSWGVTAIGDGDGARAVGILAGGTLGPGSRAYGGGIALNYDGPAYGVLFAGSSTDRAVAGLWATSPKQSYGLVNGLGALGRRLGQKVAPAGRRLMDRLP